jgi:TolA-binding protein
LAQIELKKPVDAKSALQRVIREYPNTNAANLAKQKLDQLGG